MIQIFGREQSATSAVQYFVGEKELCMSVKVACNPKRCTYEVKLFYCVDWIVRGEVRIS